MSLLSDQATRVVPAAMLCPRHDDRFPLASRASIVINSLDFVSNPA